MKEPILIPQEISEKIIMVGVKRDTPGGMASVINSYFKYIDKLQYITTWKLSSFPVKVWYAFKSILQFLLQLIFNRKIEIVHIQGAANASFARKAVFVNLAKAFGKRVILHMHACDFVPYYDNHNNKEWIVKTILRCDIFIVLSQSWKEYFISIGVPEHKITILNNIVTPPQCKPQRSKDDKLHLLFLGEIGKRKGVYDLLQAIANDKDAFASKLLLRIGGNLEEEKLRAFIRDNGLTDIVTFEGWVAGDKKQKCLEWADVYILPSYNEGLPIAILESLSYSMPIISTPVGGIPEVVHTHVNGILVEPGNLQEIKESVLFFINNPSKIEEYGNKSYAYAKPYFPEEVMGNLCSIYRSLLK